MIINGPPHQHFSLFFDTSEFNAQETTFKTTTILHVFSRRCTNSQEEMFDAEVHVLILLIILWLFCQKNLQLNSKTSFKPLFMMQCARDQRNTKEIWELKKYIISYLIQ